MTVQTAELIQKGGQPQEPATGSRALQKLAAIGIVRLHVLPAGLIQWILCVHSRVNRRK
jgi:hypothetical protein